MHYHMGGILVWCPPAHSLAKESMQTRALRVRCLATPRACYPVDWNANRVSVPLSAPLDLEAVARAQWLFGKRVL